MFDITSIVFRIIYVLYLTFLLIMFLMVPWVIGRICDVGMFGAHGERLVYREEGSSWVTKHNYLVDERNIKMVNTYV